MPLIIVLLGFLQFTPTGGTVQPPPGGTVPPGQMVEAPDGQIMANFTSVPFAPRPEK